MCCRRNGAIGGGINERGEKERGGEQTNVSCGEIIRFVNVAIVQHTGAD